MGGIQITETALIAGSMGIVIGILLVVVVVVVIIAVCISRRRKSTRQGTIQTDAQLGGINNPIYDEGTLPTYEDLDAFQKKVYPSNEPEYEVMENFKIDLASKFGTVNASYEDEKKALENMYNN